MGRWTWPREPSPGCRCSYPPHFSCTSTTRDHPSQRLKNNRDDRASHSELARVLVVYKYKARRRTPKHLHSSPDVGHFLCYCCCCFILFSSPSTRPSAIVHLPRRTSSIYYPDLVVEKHRRSKVISKSSSSAAKELDFSSPTSLPVKTKLPQKALCTATCRRLDSNATGLAKFPTLVLEVQCSSLICTLQL